MPRVTTQFYSSENASRATEGETGGRAKLFVYTCRFTGKHALVTDVSLKSLPLRPRDSASVLDMGKHETKVYLTDGGVKRIKREGDGKVERQYRLNLGELPVAYTFEPDGKLLYILKDALKEYQTKEQTYGESNLPPGIQEEISQDGASVRLLLDVSVAGRGGSRTRPGVYNIFNEKITVKVVQPATTAEGKKEVLALFAQVLEVRQMQLTFLELGANKGFALQVSGKTPVQVFKKLKFHTSKKNPANQPKGGGPQRRGYP